VIPIVNLRKRFGLLPHELDDETRIIVVNVHDKTVGCIVDAVTQVMRINRAQIHNYRKSTGFRLGLLMNFGHHPLLEYERIVL
jgi:chemotaxis signal transduction protein